MLSLKARVERAEKQQQEAVFKSQADFLARLPDDWLLEFLRLELHRWASGFASAPRLAVLPEVDRKRLVAFAVDDALLARCHAEPFGTEQRERLAAMEQELVALWRARGLPEAWLWVQ